MVCYFMGRLNGAAFKHLLTIMGFIINLSIWRGLGLPKSKEEKKMKKIAILILIAILTLSVASCATKGQTGALVGTGVGAAVGAGLGQAIGGSTEATLIGAGIGAAVGGLAGWQIGAYMDRQEAAMQQAFADSEAASIRRDQDVLTATFKGDVFFDYDSAILKPGAYNEIDRTARVLNQYPQTTILISGHTDSRGSEEYNMRLSQRRAEAVRDALISRGVDSRRLRAIGYGESQPISSSHAMNRRVELRIEAIQQG
jgi:outer membrane protein OmpA-like peptidoglycan-associated protein